jgi:hypothetical protein
VFPVQSVTFEGRDSLEVTRQDDQRSKELWRTEQSQAVNSRMKRLLPEFMNVVLIGLGVLSASVGLKGFLLSSNFIDGGVTGISMLLAKTTGLSLSVLLPLVKSAIRRGGLPSDGARVRCAKCAWDHRTCRRPRHHSVS